MSSSQLYHPMPHNDHIAGLILKHLQEEFTADEKSVLEKWIAADGGNRKQLEQLANDETLQKELFANAESDRRIKEQVYARIGIAF
jgi:hypothetical protein